MIIDWRSGDLCRAYYTPPISMVIHISVYTPHVVVTSRCGYIRVVLTSRCRYVPLRLHPVVVTSRRGSVPIRFCCVNATSATTFKNVVVESCQIPSNSIETRLSHQIRPNHVKSRRRSRRLPSTPVEFRRIPSNPVKSRKIPLNPVESRRIPSNPVESRRIPSNLAKSRQIPPNYGRTASGAVQSRSVAYTCALQRRRVHTAWRTRSARRSVNAPAPAS